MRGRPIRIVPRPVKARGDIVELPANAQIDDVVGTIDLRAALGRGEVAFRPRIARAGQPVDPLRRMKSICSPT